MAPKARNPLPRYKAHVIAGRRRSKGGLADQVIGHDAPQIAGPSRPRIEVQGKGRSPVQHFRIPDRARRIFGDVRPQAQLFHQLLRAMGKRDVAPILGRLGYRLQRLRFDNRDIQPARAKRPGKAEPRRPRTNHNHIRFATPCHS